MKAGIVFNVSVFVCVCVNEPKSGSRDMSCSVDKWTTIQVVAVFVFSAHRVSIISFATVGDADMKLGSCVVGSELPAEFEGSCGTATQLGLEALRLV